MAGGGVMNQKPLYEMGLNAEGEPEQFPQVWMNKHSGHMFVVVPWWEILNQDTMLDGRLSQIDQRVTDDRRFRFGMLSQVGWLIENGNGIFFGVGPQAMEWMEKVGDL